MSNVQTNLGTVIEEAKSLLPTKEIYEDLAKPIAKELGKTGETVGSLVNSVLRPLKSLDMSWNCMFDNLDTWLSEKLKKTPKSQIREPKPSVAGNILSGLVLVQEEPLLRDMFLELLATSMIKDKYKNAHPSYAGIIKELTPDEARINKYLAKNGKIPIVRLRVRLPNDSLKNIFDDITDYNLLPRDKEIITAKCTQEIFAAKCINLHLLNQKINIAPIKNDEASIFSSIEDIFNAEYYNPIPWTEEILLTYFPESVNIEDTEQIPLYLDNMVRNRIGHIYLDNAIADEEVYNEIYNSKLLKEYSSQYEEKGFNITLLPCLLVETNFGKRFHSACLSTSMIKQAD